MPRITGRRHPLFLRLQKPIDSAYPEPATPVGWDDDEPLDEVEGVVYIVTQPCAELRKWATQMRKLHRADNSHETDIRISPISAAPIQSKNLTRIGQWKRSFLNEDYNNVKTAVSAHMLDASVTWIAVVTDRLGGKGVGFISFELLWSVDAAASGDVAFEVEPDQAWIAPAFRGRGWGDTAAVAIALAIKKHMQQIEQTTRWPSGFKIDLKMLIGADVYSSSGDSFLRQLAFYVHMQFDATVPSRIVLADFEFESRI